MAHCASELKPSAPWRVAAVKVLSDHRLRVRFVDGTQGEVLLAGLIHRADAGVFAQLRDEAPFTNVHVELGAVTWPGGLDLAPDAMYDGIRTSGAWAP